MGEDEVARRLRENMPAESTIDIDDHAKRIEDVVLRARANHDRRLPPAGETLTSGKDTARIVQPSDG